MSYSRPAGCRGKETVSKEGEACKGGQGGRLYLFFHLQNVQSTSPIKRLTYEGQIQTDSKTDFLH